MMTFEEQFEALVRRAVVDGIAESRSLLREEIRTVLAETATASDGQMDPEGEVDTKTAATLAHVKPRTINEWKRRGWLTPIKRGKSDVFRAGDVLTVARERGAPRTILDYGTEAERLLSQKGRSA